MRMTYLRGTVACVMLLTAAPTEAACLIPPFAASYEVEALGLDTGSSHDHVERIGDEFRIETTADAHVLFYRRNEIEKTSGKIVAGDFKPQVYSWKMSSGSGGQAKVKEGSLDTLTLGLQLRADLARKKLPPSLQVSDENSALHEAKIKLLPKPGKVSTKVGDFATQIVELSGLPLIRQLWFDAEGDHRLVRIVVHDSAVGKVNITLTSYEKKDGPCILEE